MSRKFRILMLFISASLTMAAQTFHIAPAVTPSTIIEGISLRDCWAPQLVAINNSTEIAFRATCNDRGVLFTSRRVVAKEGDWIDGNYVALISSVDPIAINEHGQVAYVAYYAGPNESPIPPDCHPGIFVERHLVLTIPKESKIASLALSEDGKVSFNQPARQIAPTSPSTPSAAAQKIPGILRQIPIKLPPLRLPKNVPIGIPSIPPIPQSPSGPANAARTPAPSFPMFVSNSRGQIAIPANLPDGHFVILLASPATSAYRRVTLFQGHAPKGGTHAKAR